MGGVNEFGRSAIPPLAQPQGGEGCVINRFREATESDAAGVVFLSFSIGKPPRPRSQRRLRSIFLIVRPPLLAVVQGGEWHSPAVLAHLQSETPHFFPASNISGSENVNTEFSVISATMISLCLGSTTTPRGFLR